MARTEYLLTINSDENDTRLALLHTTVMKYGTAYNTLAAGTGLSGPIRHACSAWIARRDPDDTGTSPQLTPGRDCAALPPRRLPLDSRRTAAEDARFRDVHIDNGGWGDWGTNRSLPVVQGEAPNDQVVGL